MLKRTFANLCKIEAMQGLFLGGVKNPKGSKRIIKSTIDLGETIFHKEYDKYKNKEITTEQIQCFFVDEFKKIAISEIAFAETFMDCMKITRD